VVLATALGFAASRWLAFEQGPLVGLLLGFVAAQFVPTKASCAIKLPQRDIGAATDERADH
jgi:hypothetical protein